MSAISSIASSFPIPGTPAAASTRGNAGGGNASGGLGASFAATATDLAESAGPNIQTGESNPFAEVTSEEWLGIILEELSNQDPFEPNDTSATLEQLNSLRSIESDLSLQDQLESLVLQNSIGQAGSLIGKEVEGLSATGLNVTGTVASVRVVEGKSQLQLESGSTIEFKNVTNVANASAAAPAPALGSLASDPRSASPRSIALGTDSLSGATPVIAATPVTGSTAPPATTGNTPDVEALTKALAGLTDTLNASAATNPRP